MHRGIMSQPTDKKIAKISLEAIENIGSKAEEEYKNKAISGFNFLGNTFKLTTKNEHRSYYQKLIENPESSVLSQAALETLAIIAYKQPITRTEIEQIRGVNCDYAIQLLQKNNLISVVGRKDAVGKPLLFGTTDDFLKRFEL